MALRLSKNDRFGSTHATSHAVIETADVNFVEDTARVVVSFYVDEAAFIAGKDPFEKNVFELAFSSLVKTNIQDHAQSLLVLLSEFATATEV